MTEPVPWLDHGQRVSSWTVASAHANYVGQRAVAAVAFADVAHHQNVVVGAAEVVLRDVKWARPAAVRPQSAPRLQVVAAFAELVDFHCLIVAARSSEDECHC
jgi:hypothetical protein